MNKPSPNPSISPTLRDHLRHSLIAWYDTHRRQLPWRETLSAYRTWVSEIMLQQTQVKTVIPYFERWMTRFPTLADLANASLEDVLALWSGLGYYRRARSLHQAAQVIHTEHDGVFPTDFDDILALPGIGRYTAGAIASIALGQARPIVDGNVARVLCRLLALEGDPTKNPVRKTLWSVAQDLVPEHRPSAFNQGLMELGATVCARAQPACDRCPWQTHCQAFASQRQRELPTPRARPKKRPHVVAGGLLITVQDARTPHVLLAQRPVEGLWGGLWEIPMLELQRYPTRRASLPNRLLGTKTRRQLEAFAHKHLGLSLTLSRPQAPLDHALTHMDWTLIPWPVTLDRAALPTLHDVPYTNAGWYNTTALQALGVPKLTDRLLRPLLERNASPTDPAPGLPLFAADNTPDGSA